ncbi:hypothetical protein SFUMM280S_07325 [Streptomyces fumanus]
MREVIATYWKAATDPSGAVAPAPASVPVPFPADRQQRKSDAPMKFGLLYGAQLPRPWTEDSEYRLFHDMLAEIELADRLGFDDARCPEHHFLEEYSHMSGPEVFLGAVSQRTSRIRIGTPSP